MIVPLSVTSKRTGRHVAVLTPKEKDAIWINLNETYRMRMDLLLYTGMRIAEAHFFSKHTDWFRKENGAIFLPAIEGLGKKKCKTARRTIVLSNNGIKAVEEFISHGIKFPTHTRKGTEYISYQNMEEALVLAARKAGFDTSYITTKLCRKTIISWMLVVFKDQIPQINRFAGHDVQTMSDHYIAEGWIKDDKKDMVEELKGWGEI